MDVILDCFFEQYFKELERSVLLCRSKRREMVDYFNTIITACSAGEDIDTETACSLAVRAAIKYHNDHKETNGTICLMGKYHNVLYLAVKICFDWKLRNSQLVAELLNEIYQCEHTFERIFVGAIFGPTAPHFISGWKSDFKNRDENVHALTYFLNQATYAALEFSQGLRFVDVPIESCGHSSPVRVVIQVGAPDILLILLRFGATLRPDKVSTSSIETILDRLNEYTDTRVYPFTLVACLKFILRATRTISIPATSPEKDCDEKLNIERIRDHLTRVEERDSEFATPYTTGNLILRKYKFLIDDELIPESRCGIKPPELKHLTRCIIRECLWKNYQLPHGIQRLQISEDMRSYIDLQVD